MTLVEVEFTAATATRAKGDRARVDPASAESLCSKGVARRVGDKPKPKPKPKPEPEVTPEPEPVVETPAS